MVWLVVKEADSIVSIMEAVDGCLLRYSRKWIECGRT